MNLPHYNTDSLSFLSKNEYKVFMHIARITNYGDRQFFERRKVTAEKTSLSLRTVKDIVEKFVVCGILSQTTRTSRNVKYRFLPPKDWQVYQAFLDFYQFVKCKSKENPGNLDQFLHFTFRSFCTSLCSNLHFMSLYIILSININIKYSLNIPARDAKMEREDFIFVSAENNMIDKEELNEDHKACNFSPSQAQDEKVTSQKKEPGKLQLKGRLAHKSFLSQAQVKDLYRKKKATDFLSSKSMKASSLARKESFSSKLNVGDPMGVPGVDFASWRAAAIAELGGESEYRKFLTYAKTVKLSNVKAFPMRSPRDAENYLLFQFRRQDGEIYLNNILLDYLDQIMAVQQTIMPPVEVKRKPKERKSEQDEKAKASILDRLKSPDTNQKKRSLLPSVSRQK